MYNIVYVIHHMGDTTRISELPENITMNLQPPAQYHMQIPPQQSREATYGGSGKAGAQYNTHIDTSLGNNTYQPINIHPNPYQNGPGISPGTSASLGPSLDGFGQASLQQQQQQHRLPSRDIPTDSTHLQQDEEIQPNFIPKVKLTADYIRKYEEETEPALEEHAAAKYRGKVASNWATTLMMPILVAVLFFFFQMPIVNRLFFKYVRFLPIYSEDGLMNIYGLLLKSLLFGIVYFFYSQSVDYLSSI